MAIACASTRPLGIPSVIGAASVSTSDIACRHQHVHLCRLIMTTPVMPAYHRIFAYVAIGSRWALLPKAMSMADVASPYVSLHRRRGMRYGLCFCASSTAGASSKIYRFTASRLTRDVIALAQASPRSPYVTWKAAADIMPLRQPRHAYSRSSSHLWVRRQ